MTPTGQTLARSAVFLTATELVAKATSLFLIMVVARQLGPTMMGIYGFAVGLVGFLDVAVDFGLETYIQREVGRAPELAGPLRAQVLVFQTGLFLVGGAVFFLAVQGLAEPGLKRQVIYLLAAAVYFRVQLLATNAFFRAHLKTGSEAAVRIGLHLGYSASGLWAMLSGQGLLFLVILELTWQAGACLAAGALFVTRIGWPFQSFPLRRLKELAQASKNFLFYGVVNVLFNSLDVLMLSWLSGDLATGLYAAALKLPAALECLPAAFKGAFLPTLSRQANYDPQGFSRTFGHYFKCLLILGLGAAATLGGLAEDVVLLLFGPAFKPAVPTLALLSLSMLGTFVSWPLSNALIAFNRERVMLGVFILGAGCNTLLNLLLIPHLQHNGAALANLAARLLVISLQLAALGRIWRGRLHLVQLAVRPTLAGLASFGLGLTLDRLGLPWFLALPAAGLGFVVALFATRTLTVTEVKEVGAGLWARS